MGTGSMQKELKDMNYDEFKTILAEHGITPGINDPRATDEDIQKIEKELGVALPTDFVRFHKEFGVKRWPGFYSAKWSKKGKCEFVEEQDDRNGKNRFVKIGDFLDEDYNLDYGQYGFLVIDGQCIEDKSGTVADILVFLLGEVIDEYKRVNGGDDDEDLIVAANNGRTGIVRVLIEEGVNVNHQSENDGWTALTEAASRGYTKIVELLLKNGADINLTNAEGKTPLSLAVNDETRQMLEAGTASD